MQPNSDEMKQRIADAARRAIGYVGGASATARRLNLILPPEDQLTTQAVAKWLKAGVPPTRCLAMEKLQAKYDRHVLRPDVYGERPK